MLCVIYHLVNDTLLFLLNQLDCRLYQLKRDILYPFLFPLNTVPSNFLFLTAFTILSGLLPFTKNTSVPIFEIFVASSTFLVIPPVTSMLFFEIIGFSPFNSRINFFDFRSEYNPSSFRAKILNLGFTIFSISFILFVMGLSRDIKSVGGRQYGFDLFFKNASKIILFNSIIEFLTIDTPCVLYFIGFVCISYFTDQ